MKFVMRKAVPEDIPGIMNIMDSAKTDLDDPDWFVADDEAFVRSHVDGDGFIVVAESEMNSIAGFFLVKVPRLEENLGTFLDFTEEELEKVLVMDSAAVDRRYRGNGLQGRMLEAAERMAVPGKYKYLMCTVHPENKYSLQNMQKHGYEIKRTVYCYGGLKRHILLKKL